MKRINIVMILLSICAMSAFAQQSLRYKTHVRSLLRQTMYYTGEIGRPFNASNAQEVGITKKTSSWEWPPSEGNIFLDNFEYLGHHNSFGAGVLLSATIDGQKVRRACGIMGDGSGGTIQIEDVYVKAIGISRKENYPILEDGTLNPNYDPNEAEEIIIAKYQTIEPMKLEVKQTSRAWGYRGYDAFVIIEYEIVNIDTIEYPDGFVVFGAAIAPSAFGMERKYGGLWQEGSNTTRSKEIYARYNFTRYLSYVHTRNGFPEEKYFNVWSTEGNRGGLNAPQAVGYMVLHYDTTQLQPQWRTLYSGTDSTRVWDELGKFRQPYVTQQIPNRNRALYDTQIGAMLDLSLSRPYSAFDMKAGSADSTSWANFNYPYASIDAAKNLELMKYWHGRAKPRALSNGNYSQTTLHYTSFGPYVFKPGVPVRFAIAQLVGYGPGTAADTVLRDAGGASTEPSGQSTGWYKPVVSWYDSITYPGIHANYPYMGSAYLKKYPLPWYVAGQISTDDPEPVISLRQVADRAIQIYTGQPYKKYDTEQYKAEISPAKGVYQIPYIPLPSPIIEVHNQADFKNIIVWSTAVEDFESSTAVQGRIRSGFSHYLVLKSPDALGPWKVIDSITRRAPQYYNIDVNYPGCYVVRDTSSLISENYYYAVLTVDSLGTKSGWTNITYHETQKGAVSKLGKVYVAPNPLIVASNFGGSTKMGDIHDKICFYGLPSRSNIRIFSYSGQLVGTIEHRSDTYSTEWFQISRNNQRIASGVYFFVVEDLDTGDRAHGKFVIIH
ncbi:MAG TPA: T9SS C-terminal target domain-containing protein [Bacteroidota bacterium]|nr:T9SS C-terminal target domain-containing protein [Bacteroidota bacterium]